MNNKYVIVYPRGVDYEDRKKRWAALYSRMNTVLVSLANNGEQNNQDYFGLSRTQEWKKFEWNELSFNFRLNDNFSTCYSDFYFPQKKGISYYLSSVLKNFCCKPLEKINTLEASSYQIDTQPPNSAANLIFRSDENDNKYYFAKSFNKIRKNILGNQHLINSIAKIENICMYNSTSPNNRGSIHYIFDVCGTPLYDSWLGELFNIVSSLLFKPIRFKKLFNWRFIWTILSIIWLNNFLSNCNLNIRAV